MRKRCDNSNHWAFRHYGGRGIRVCAEWEEFEAFHKWAVENGYSDTLSIDRVDVNGDYHPDNCRWATMKEQMNNTRTNHRVKVLQTEMTIAEWAEALKIPRHRLDDAYRRGGDIEGYILRELQREV